MGPIYFGTSLTQANVTFDTGSSWLAVTSSLCTHCPSNVYQQSDSLESVDLGIDATLTYPTEDITLQTVEYTD